MRGRKSARCAAKAKDIHLHFYIKQQLIKFACAWIHLKSFIITGVHYMRIIYSQTPELLSNIVINRDFNEYIGMGSAPQLEDDSDTLRCKLIVCSTFRSYKIEFDGLKWTGYWRFLQGVLITNEKPDKCMLKCSGWLFEVVAM